MGILSDVLTAALRDYGAPQMGAGGSQSLADAPRAILAPRAAAVGMPPAAVEVEGDVPYQLFARFERSGYAASVRSWIGTAPNQLIEPRQAAHALGTEGVDELAGRTGLARDGLLGQLARRLPTGIDHLTPRRRLDTVRRP